MLCATCVAAAGQEAESHARSVRRKMRPINVEAGRWNRWTRQGGGRRVGRVRYSTPYLGSFKCRPCCVAILFLSIKRELMPYGMADALVRSLSHARSLSMRQWTDSQGRNSPTNVGNTGAKKRYSEVCTVLATRRVGGKGGRLERRYFDGVALAMGHFCDHKVRLACL